MDSPNATDAQRAADGIALMTEMLGTDLVARIAERNKIAPAWQKWTTEVLFGQLWQDDVLPRRIRSMLTIAALVPTTRARELENHMRAAMNANGVTAEEVSAIVQHVGFYAGWPAVGEALSILDRILKEDPVAGDRDAE